MSQSQSLQITSRPVSHPPDAGLRRPGAALLIACAPVSIAGTLRAEGLRLVVFDVGAPPPVRSMMAYDPVKAQGGLALRGRGVNLTETKYQLGRVLKFDAKRERFVGEGALQANTLLTRNCRPPFVVPDKL